jgi:hypothetical protein
MIKLKDIIYENINSIPSFDDVWKNVVIPSGGENNRNEILNIYKKSIKYNQSLNGKKCYRTMCLSNDVDPIRLNNIGVHWTTRNDMWMTFCTENEDYTKYPIKIQYEAIIDLKNINWKETIYHSIHEWLYETDENEIEFIKGSRLFVNSVFVVNMLENERIFGYNMKKYKGRVGKIRSYKTL